METAVILSAKRTPIGKYGKSISGIKATDLGAIVVKSAVEEAGIESRNVDECIMGNVISAGQGQNPARQAAINGGLPVEVGSFTVNAVCGSGMKAVMLAADSIRIGDYKCVVAGGMENMSAAPYLIFGARFGFKMNDQIIKDSMILDGLWDVFTNRHMGFTGEIVADKFNISREEADLFSYESHIKASKAATSGAFRDEISPILIKQGDKNVTFDKDEGIRENTSVEVLSKLKPVFKTNGKVTAGNSSQLSDGASALVIASSSFAKEYGLKPLATIEAYGECGVPPELIMEAPIPATKYVLKKAKIGIDDIDLFEHNEAFATASCAVKKSLNIPRESFNVNGGAIALGHPIGCSGARILTTLLHAMIKRNKNIGLGTLCFGGGNGVAMVLTRW
ncbi:MAG: acetyl-CoA C-acetyltransferase [archaeon]|nr:acetyl-CoA C-acetyltransferase [archaeon]